MNPDVQRLIDALFYLDVQPTRDEVQKACELIYRIGKNDGARMMLSAVEGEEPKP